MNYAEQYELEMWDAAASSGPRYSVKCDECKRDIRYTDSVAESAAGGTCDSCKQDPAVVGPTRARLERRAAKRRDCAV